MFIETNKRMQPDELVNLNNLRNAIDYTPDMSNIFWSLCRELTDHLALQDEPPHELVNRAQYFLSKYGCWLDEGQQNLPDTCVLDTGNPQDCWHAERLVKEGKDKCNCQYWNTCHPI